MLPSRVSRHEEVGLAQRAVVCQGLPLSRQQRRALAFRERRQQDKQRKRGARALVPGAALAVGAVFAGAGATPAAAAIVTVTNTNDAGPGSLRQAIIDATGSPGTDEVVFDTAGVFAGPQIINLDSGLPTILSAGGPLTVQGTGPTRLTIRRDPGAPSFRLFDHAGGVAAPLVITGVTLTGGDVAGNGGAIFFGDDGSLTVRDSVVTGNQATGAGGAIYLGFGSELTIQGSTISGNSAGAEGGGVYFFDNNTLTVQDSTITGNTTIGDGGGVYFYTGPSVTVQRSVISGNTAGLNGGGLYFYGAPPVTVQRSVISGNTAGVDGGGAYFFYGGALVVEHSTISGNTAVGDGGALYFFGSAPVTIENSTMHGNGAGGSGGGLFWYDATGNFTLRNSTVTSNVANGTAVGSGGGGIFERGPTVPLVVNSVVSGNTNVNGPDLLSLDALDALGLVDANFSAIGSNTGFTLSGSSGNNLPFGTDPLLGPLQNNGGPTPTRLPSAGSPLIEAGSSALVPASPFDQRHQCFRRIFGPVVDIGSVEVGLAPGDPVFCDGFDSDPPPDPGAAHPLAPRRR
jgi:hypothetical protein